MKTATEKVVHAVAVLSAGAEGNVAIPKCNPTDGVTANEDLTIHDAKAAADCFASEDMKPAAKLVGTFEGPADDECPMFVVEAMTLVGVKELDVMMRLAMDDPSEVDEESGIPLA